jgi:hypothetical protein
MDDASNASARALVSAINEKQPPPADVLEMLREQRARLLEEVTARAEFEQATDPTPEETQRREELTKRIFTKLGIASELEELSKLERDFERAREKRIQEVFDRYPQSQDRSSYPTGQ